MMWQLCENRLGRIEVVDTSYRREKLLGSNGYGLSAMERIVLDLHGRVQLSPTTDLVLRKEPESEVW